MGYNGIGLRKWIYSMKPRKPFSKGRSKAFSDEIQSYSSHELHISGRTNSNTDKNKLKKKKTVSIIIALSIITATAIISITVIKNFSTKLKDNYSKEQEIMRRKKREYSYSNEQKNAYDMAIDYGDRLFNDKHYNEAIPYYQQALQLFPNDIYARESMANCMFLICFSNNTQCKDCLDQYEILYNLNPDNRYLNKKSDIYIHLNDYKNAELEIERIEDTLFIDTTMK